MPINSIPNMRYSRLKLIREIVQGLLCLTLVPTFCRTCGGQD